MSSSAQPKYIPPHMRRHSTSTTSKEEEPVLTAPDNLDELEKTIFNASATFRNLLSVKRRYAEDPSIDRMFEVNRQQSVRAGATSELSLRFRQQFETAMGDINDQSHGAILSVRTFLDLGCAPGGFSKWILEHNPDARGLGVTLDTADRGIGIQVDDWMKDVSDRYELLKSDVCSRATWKIIEEKTRDMGSCDLVVAGAIYRDVERRSRGEWENEAADEDAAPQNPRIILQTSQLVVALRALKEGGTLVAVLSLKPRPVTVATLFLLRRLFNRLTPTKGKYLHRTRSSYYLVCEGYKAAEAAKVVEMLVERLDGDAEWVGETNLSSDDRLAFLLAHFEPMWRAQSEAMEGKLIPSKGRFRGRS